MRIVLIGAESTGLGAALAERLQVPHVQRLDQLKGESFVLDGPPHDLSEARALDTWLNARAAPVEAVLWLRSDTTLATAAVLDHYLGRVIELDPHNDPFEASLEGLREALLAR